MIRQVELAAIVKFGDVLGLYSDDDLEDVLELWEQTVAERAQGGEEIESGRYTITDAGVAGRQFIVKGVGQE